MNTQTAWGISPKGKARTLGPVMSDMPKIQPSKKIQFFWRQFLNNDVTTSIFCSKFEPTMWPHRYFIANLNQQCDHIDILGLSYLRILSLHPPPSKSNKTPYHTACVRSKVGPRYRKWRLKQTSQVMLIFSQLKLLITGQVVQIKLY